MKLSINQTETEESVISSLLKLGYPDKEITNTLLIIKSDNPDLKAQRNVTIRELAKILKGTQTGLRPWLVYDMLSKVTGLSPQTIKVISNSRNPKKFIKNGSKN